ncbi:MAG: hypothetical protein R2784_11560 [Saprospiraceae bacterium]
MTSNFFFPIGLLFYLIVAVYQPEENASGKSHSINGIDTTKLERILMLKNSEAFRMYQANLQSDFQCMLLSKKQKEEKLRRRWELRDYLEAKAREGGFEFVDLYYSDYTGNIFMDAQKSSYEDETTCYYPGPEYMDENWEPIK